MDSVSSGERETEIETDIERVKAGYVVVDRGTTRGKDDKGRRDAIKVTQHLRRDFGFVLRLCHTAKAAAVNHNDTTTQTDNAEKRICSLRANSCHELLSTSERKSEKSKPGKTSMRNQHNREQTKRGAEPRTPLSHQAYGRAGNAKHPKLNGFVCAHRRFGHFLFCFAVSVCLPIVLHVCRLSGSVQAQTPKIKTKNTPKHTHTHKQRRAQTASSVGNTR